MAKQTGQPAPVTDLASLPAVLTVEEAANLLRISPKTAKDWARAGELPGAFKVGREWRVRRDDVLRLIAGAPGPDDAGGAPTLGGPGGQ